jgi:aminopeptidase N
VDWRIYDTGTFRTYVNAIYFQGAKFLQGLRDRIGDAAFFAFIQDYYARNRGRIASSADFFAILNEHTTADYSDLIRAYFTYR